MASGSPDAVKLPDALDTPDGLGALDCKQSALEQSDAQVTNNTETNRFMVLPSLMYL
jgi:hypothetical protein